MSRADLLDTHLLNLRVFGMTGFLHKIKSLARGPDTPRESPFSSVRATQKWLQNLPGLSDYDVHHALVEGLERYNGDIRGDTLTRIKILRQIEEAGLPLQEKIIAQYLGSYAANESSRHTLWRECHLFWDQLAVAYLPFLRLAVRGGDAGNLSQFGTEIAAKGLRYFSLGMRWEYLRGRRPSESAWRRLHKIYRMTEMTGVVFGDVQIEGKKTSCARDYVMTMLFDLATPYAFRAEEIQAVLDILDGLKELPAPETNLRHGRHTHMIDLAGSGGPEKIEDRWVPGGRLRYLDMHGVVHELEERANRDSPDSTLCRKLAKVIGRAGASRRGPRKPRFGEVKAVFGADAVMKVFDPQRGALAQPEFINLRDESHKGMGFVLEEDRGLASGSLLAIDRDGVHGVWQLLAVRWYAMEEHHWLLGTEILSKYPKRVEIEWETGETGKESAVAIFLPLASITQGATSNLLLPSAAYSAERSVLLRQDDGTHYRLKLGAVVKTHESLVRVEFDVLSRQAAGTS